MRPNFVLSLLVALLAAGTPAFVPAQAAPAAAATEFAPFPGAVPATSITTAMVGQEVTIEGALTEHIVSSGERVPHRLVFGADQRTGFTVVFWPDMAPAILGNVQQLPPGTRVTAKGKVGEHRGAAQLRAKPDSIRIGGIDPSATVKAVAAVQSTLPPAGPDGYYGPEIIPTITSFTGKEILFKAPIASFKSSWSERAPHVVGVTGPDGSSFEIVYWKKDDTTPLYDKVGSMIHARGTVGQHQGRNQMRISKLENISYDLLAGSTAATPQATGGAAWPGAAPVTATQPPKPASVAPGVVLSPADVVRDMEGLTVAIKGSVLATRQGADGVAIIVKDDKGQRIARLATGQPTPAQSTAVTVQGKVQFNTQRSSPELLEAVLLPSD